VEIGSVKIKFDPDKVSEDDIKNSIRESGYNVIE
jgi:copper chaperone CopZ